MFRTLALGLALSAAAGAVAGEAPRLAAPFRVTAAGGPVDVETGHAAPLLHDWNGDGRPDLLVGQFGQGRMRIYLNEGAAGKPAFSNHQWFEAGGKIASVPSG